MLMSLITAVIFEQYNEAPEFVDIRDHNGSQMAEIHKNGFKNGSVYSNSSNKKYTPIYIVETVLHFHRTQQSFFIFTLCNAVNQG